MSNGKLRSKVTHPLILLHTVHHVRHGALRVVLTCVDLWHALQLGNCQLSISVAYPEGSACMSKNYRTALLLGVSGVWGSWWFWGVMWVHWRLVGLAGQPCMHVGGHTLSIHTCSTHQATSTQPQTWAVVIGMLPE